MMMSMNATENTITITRETSTSTIFESVICSRCGGSGRMPYSVANGVCFKCGGGGTTLTKRGAAARAFYRSLVETPVAALQSGERVHYQGFQAGSYHQASAWVTVERVSDNAAVAAEAGSYDEALKACGSCHELSDPEKIEAAYQRGATLLPNRRGSYGCFEGLRVEGTTKDGMSYSLGAMRDGTMLAKIDGAVKVAILKTVAEYQETLTKAGKPRKGSRWAD